MMRTYRGVVFEIEKKYTVFLTGKGEFIRGIPIDGAPNIGDEVDFHLINTPSFLGRKVKPRLLGTVMVAAMLLLSILASLIPMSDEVMAYVQLESDTALELGVDETGKVIDLRYLNGTSVDSENSLNHLKGDSISKVLVTALKKLTTKDSSDLVTITIIYENTKNQQKLQKIFGNAVRELQSADNELTMKIGESTAEERVKANKQEMSVYKFQESQQVKPEKELKPSSEIDEELKDNPVNEHREKDTPINKESIPSVPVPANGKVNGNENSKGTSGSKAQKSNETIEKPIKEQKEKTKESPVEKEKGKSSNPEQGNVNSNKGNQSPASQQPKEHKNEQKQPGKANSANESSKTKDLPNSP